MISPGQKIDGHFRVKAIQHGSAKEVQFGQLLTRRTVVSVYMRNNTKSCDRQNESLAACAGRLDRAGYSLLAISRDSAGSQLRYAAAKKLNYLLVSDPDDHFARAAGILVEKSMYGRTFIGPARMAFVLERDGTVLAIIPKVDPAHHGEQLENVIKTLPGES